MGVLNGPGFINLMWMFVGIWMGLFLARALPDHAPGENQEAAAVQQTASDR